MTRLCKGYAAAEMEHYFQEWLDPFCAVRLAYSLEIVHREYLAQEIMQKQLKEKCCELERVSKLLEKQVQENDNLTMQLAAGKGYLKFAEF